MSLFDSELKSHWLKSQLSKPRSARFKILHLSEFLSILLKDDKTDKYLSYFLEFAPQLVNLILEDNPIYHTEKFDFFSPQEIEEIRFIINTLADIKQLQNKIEEFNKCNIILKEVEERINSLLINSQKTVTNDKVTSSKDSLNIVLIEADGEKESTIGTIRKLNLRSSKKGKEFREDKVEFDNDNENLLPVITELVSLIKKETVNEGLTLSYYNFDYFFDGKNTIYSGTSFGVGICALTYNSFFVNELYKKYYSFYEDVVITGSVDEFGNLIKLDNNILITKLKTVFFSHFTKFVIPEDNILEAKEELNKFLAEYPNRNLKLIPLRNFKDIFNNLEIVRLNKLKVREIIKVNYKKYHTAVNIALTFCLLLFIVFSIIHYIIPMLDRNPVYVDLLNNRYAAFNKYGKVVWESELLNKVEASYEHNNIYGSQRIAVADLDNDKNNEIISLRYSDVDKSLQRTVFCYNSNGTIKWKATIPPKDSIYGMDECYDDLMINGITVIYNKTSRQNEIIVSYKICSLFPYYLSRLNSSGKIISDFYHPGHLGFSKTDDLDNDGIIEYITGGENNDLDHCPVLLIFDPNFVIGYAPGKRLPRDFDKSLVKYFILFPKSPFNKFTSNRNASVHGIEIAKDNITVVVREVMDVYNKKVHDTANEFFSLYVFDKKFNIISFSTSTEFDVVYSALVEQKKISPIKDWKAMEDSSKSQVSWWDGDKFVNYPTMNKYYLQAKANTDSKTVQKSILPQ